MKKNIKAYNQLLLEILLCILFMMLETSLITCINSHSCQDIRNSDYESIYSDIRHNLPVSVYKSFIELLKLNMNRVPYCAK